MDDISENQTLVGVRDWRAASANVEEQVMSLNAERKTKEQRAVEKKKRNMNREK